MRLCYIANPRSPHTRRWLEYFVRQGHEVHLLTFYRDFIPLEGVKSYQILPSSLNKIKRGRGWLALLFPWRIRRLIQTINPDMLHAHYIGFYGWLAALSGFHPFVLTMWGSDVFLAHKGMQKILSYWLTPFALKKADLVTAVSQYLLTTARRNIDPSLIGHVIRIGADLNNFNPSADVKLWKTQLQLGDNPVILSPRVFAPVYNIHMIVAAIPYVLEQIPEAIFVFKDNTSTGKGSYRARVRQIITDMKLGQAVRYVGEVPYNEMGAFYRLADVVVSVPFSDGLPVTVLEAMACGVPLVLSRLPQLEELITAGQNALTVPAEDPIQLAQAIIRLLEDKTLRQNMVAMNLALIKTHGDFDAEMKKMEKLYEEVTSRTT